MSGQADIISVFRTATQAVSAVMPISTPLVNSTTTPV